MSHAVVLVVTEEKPNNDILHDVLLPWHEYESTGYDAYTEEIDCTEEVLDEWNSENKHSGYKHADGSYSFHKKEDSDISVELPLKMFYSDIETMATDWFGFYTKKNEKDEVIGYFRKTNPNAKWDWWVVGGRWTGYFLPKQDAKYFELGEASLASSPALPNRADIIRKRDIDWETERANLTKEFSELYDKICEIVGGRPVPDFEQLKEKFGLEKARDIFNSNPVIKELREALGLFENINKTLKLSKEEFVANRVMINTIPLSIVYDGVWYERGRLGWFGMVDSEKEDEEWAKEFETIWNKIPDHYWITAVDYHI